MAVEVLSTFKMSRGTIDFHHADFIQFHVFSALHHMRLIEFSIHLGLYDTEFMRNPAYNALLISRSAGEPLSDAWQQLSSYPTYDPRWNKATAL